MKKTILLCLVLAVFLTGCGSDSSTGSKVPATKITQTDTTFLMGGKIEANEQADIAAKISAKVSAINVDIGSKVNQGDIIIQLDNKDLQAQVNQAQAGVEVAKASLANVKYSTRPEQIASAQAALDSATASYEVTKKNFERIKYLFDAEAATQQQLESAQQQLVAAEAQQKSAHESLKMLKSGFSLNVYETQVNQAEAALEIAQAALSNSAITAPISGVVNAKNINVGEMVSPGTMLVSIVNAGALYVNAYAPLDIVNKLKVGQMVKIKVSEIPDKLFAGEISVINSNVNSASGDVLVKVTLKDPDSIIKPGMFAEIGLEN